VQIDQGSLAPSRSRIRQDCHVSMPPTNDTGGRDAEERAASTGRSSSPEAIAEDLGLEQRVLSTHLQQP